MGPQEAQATGTAWAFSCLRGAPASQSHLVISTACADHTLVTQERQLGVGEESSAPGVESCTRGLLCHSGGEATAASLP